MLCDGCVCCASARRNTRGSSVTEVQTGALPICTAAPAYGLDFALGDVADAIRETTSRFAVDRIAPIAAEIDVTNVFPRALWPEMGALGLHGITVEEEFGGLGLGYLEHVVVMEEVSRASASVGLSYGAQDRKSTRLNSSH